MVFSLYVCLCVTHLIPSLVSARPAASFEWFFGQLHMPSTSLSPLYSKYMYFMELLSEFKIYEQKVQLLGEDSSCLHLDQSLGVWSCCNNAYIQWKDWPAVLYADVYTLVP